MDEAAFDDGALADGALTDGALTDGALAGSAGSALIEEALGRGAAPAPSAESFGSGLLVRVATTFAG